MFTLHDGPRLPRHVSLDRSGIPYTREVERDDADLPARFLGPARPDDDAAPRWPTLIAGLETDRFDMRERFLTALRADVAAGISGRALERYGDALMAAFHDIFGGRGATRDTAGFLAFLHSTIAAERDPTVRGQLERGLVEREERPIDPRIAEAGADAVSFNEETGHVPADHVSVLYWMARLIPGWDNVVFDQIASESEDADPDHPHTLEAWWAGTRLRAPAENMADYVDPWSCAALINVIQRDVARSDARILVFAEDDTVLAVGGPRRALVALKDLLAPTDR